MLWLGKLFSSRLTWIAIAVVAGAIWMLWLQDEAYESGVRDERQRQSNALARAMNQIKMDHEQALKARGWQDTSEADRSREVQRELQRRLADIAAMPPRTLIKTVVKQNENGCSCPDPSLGNAFWMRYRDAGNSGGAIDPAAAGAVRDEMR